MKGKPPTGQDLPAAPCIFCGETITHFNDGGRGWLLGAVVRGKKKLFLYCDQPICAAGKKDVKAGNSIWRCGCVADYVENVGPRCHMCQRLRRDRRPVQV